MNALGDFDKGLHEIFRITLSFFQMGILSWLREKMVTISTKLLMIGTFYEISILI